MGTSFLNSTVLSKTLILFEHPAWHFVLTCLYKDMSLYTYCTLTRVNSLQIQQETRFYCLWLSLHKFQVLFVHSTLATKANGTRVLLTEVMCTRCPLLDLSFTILYLPLRSLPKPFLRRVIVFDVFNDLFTHT